MIDLTYLGFFRTLNNDTRLSIVLCLKDSPKNVSQLSTDLSMEQSRISHNLQCLEKNGFVTVKQEGKQRIYLLNKDTIDPILVAVKKHVKKYKINSC
jgi:DNA-binding transcriptional ArsR family regulator